LGRERSGGSHLALLPLEPTHKTWLLRTDFRGPRECQGDWRGFWFIA
jgi:hypothetical protein